MANIVVSEETTGRRMASGPAKPFPEARRMTLLFHGRPPLRRQASRMAALALLLTVLLAACATSRPPPGPATRPPTLLPMMGITIQAGAFARIDNAVRLTEVLQSRGLEATFFRDDDGLFKVRFGNFPSREEARQKALALQRDGTLEVFYIVVPEQYTAAARERRGEAFVRQQIVHTAEGFIGLPYRWGGVSAEDGFDCSGLTMTAYRLNGYDLPRTSGEQYSAGDPISTASLQQADLVFFRIPDKGGVSHVGLYIGEGRFIHAPGSGKTIRIDSLDQDYYRRHLVGARRFL